MKNDLINGRTPEEIKAGLKACTTAKVPGYGCNIPCPYLNTPNCWLPVKSDALALIERLETKVPRWISVEDQPEPPRDGEYWCYGYWIGSGRKQAETAQYLCGEWKIVNNFVLTHWMPLLPDPANNE